MYMIDSELTFVQVLVILQKRMNVINNKYVEI